MKTNDTNDTPEPLAAILAEMRESSLATVRNWADRIEAAVQRFVADDCSKCAHYNAATISLKDALDLANTIANHGINANDLGDKASATIYALCHEVRTVRGEDANIKQEVQKLRRELRDLRRAPGNAAAMRAVIEELAAPARNCDRFRNFDEAIKTYAKENNVKVPWDMEKYARLSMWLFAPAEGGKE